MGGVSTSRLIRGLLTGFFALGTMGCSDSEDPPPGASGEFLALTYNVAGLPEGLTSSPNPLVRMPLISPLLNDYDLVLTQEDWETPEMNPLTPARVYHELLAEFAEHPYRSVSMPVPLGTDPEHWPATPEREAIPALLSDGLNEFSRIPFDPAATIHVTWDDCFGNATTGAADCLATKGFTVTTHTIAPGLELDVYNLHGEAGGGERDELLNRANFEQQLADYISDPARAGRAIVLGGDTNLHTDRAEEGAAWRSFLDRTGMTDVCEAVDCGDDDHDIDKFAFRSSSSLTIEALSHSFESAKFSYEGGPLSDHEPLAVRFRWSQR